MKIFVDENIPLITVKELCEQGFDVIDIRGTNDQGITDEDLWHKVQNEKCLLITDLVNSARNWHLRIQEWNVPYDLLM